MKFPFTCPSCGFSGSLDAASAGKTIRCKHCGHRSTAPEAGEPEASVYMLEAPAAETPGEFARAPAGDSAFVPNPEHGATSAPPPRGKPRKAPRSVARKRGADFAWPKWLIGFAVTTTLALVAVSIFVPSGKLITACAVIVIGSAMLLLGYFVGAYGAFREDFLYGLLYLLIPLYTAYYIVTRWDDLWVWCTCSTAGVGLILFGAQIARWSGLGA